MKKSELREMIREEIKNKNGKRSIIKEGVLTAIFAILPVPKKYLLKAMDKIKDELAKANMFDEEEIDEIIEDVTTQVNKGKFKSLLGMVSYIQEKYD